MEHHLTAISIATSCVSPPVMVGRAKLYFNRSSLLAHLFFVYTSDYDRCFATSTTNYVFQYII